MTELILNIDASEVYKAAQDLNQLEAILAEELNVAMESSLQLLEGQVVARTPVDTGALRDSINHGIDAPFPNLLGYVGSPRDPYARVIEYGRTPGSRPPPVDAIRLWVERKLNVPEEEVLGVAWLIAQHIGLYGFTTIPEGARMFEESTETSAPFINQIFRNAVQKTANRLKI